MGTSIMNKRTSLLALAAIMTALAGNAALAADLAPPPPPAPEIRPSVSDWSGPYLGAVLGGTCMETRAHATTYGYTDNNGNRIYDAGDTRNGSPSEILSQDLNGCGFTGGVMAGYNLQVEDIVFGVEGDWTWGGKTAEHIAHHYDKSGNRYSQEDHYNIDWMASLRLRAGLLATDKTLLYVTGGIGWLRGEAEDVNSGASFKETHVGYILGGGVEHALTENIHLRGEYLFSSYNRKKYGTFCTACDVAVDVEPKMSQFHTFRMGVNWNFPISQW